MQKKVNRRTWRRIHFGKGISKLGSAMALFTMSGCSLSDLDSAMSGDFSTTQSISGEMNIVTSTSNTIAKTILPVYKMLDPYLLWMALVSFIIGCVMLFFFHDSKSMSKLAIFSFMLLIPLLLIVVDIGVGAWLSNTLY